MDLPWPCRIIIVGGSETGKTYLVRTLLLRGDFGARKKEIDVVVITPQQASLEQNIWTDLCYRGFRIKKTLCRRGHPAPIIKDLFPPPAPGLRRLLIIDDVDQASELRFANGVRGREWLMDLFGTESHHSNIGVILICHHLNIGCPAIKKSAGGVVITGLPIADIHSLCKSLALSPSEEDEILKEMSNVSGLVSTTRCSHSPKYVSLYNNVYISQKLSFLPPSSGTNHLIPAPTIWKFDNRISGVKGLIPII